jgi:hypothetical protein
VTSGILDVIDGALRDCAVSTDAMRWLPEEEREVAPAGAAPVLAAVTFDPAPFRMAMEEMGRGLRRLFSDFGTAFGKLAVDGHAYQRRLAARRKRRRR